jgi:DtxR family manganese transport transcriptional regulator
MRVPASQDSSARFRSTRAAHRDETAQDYVEAILQIGGDGGAARVRDLAAFMGVSHVTVSRIVARLAREGFVVTEPYRPISLTAKGRRLAAGIRQRHEVVLGFLRAIGVPEAQAEIDAEGIEHHVSGATIGAMRRLLESGARGLRGPSRG